MEWNSFCRLSRLLLPAALLGAAILAAQSSAGYLTIGQAQRVIGARSAAVQSRISCSVQAGYHVNSDTPAEEYLIPLKLTWTSTGALEAGQVVYPKPVMQKYAFSEKPLSVFSGKFDVIANFKVAANAAAGPGMASGKLRYQACNDRACFPPKTIDVSIPYQVQ